MRTGLGKLAVVGLALIALVACSDKEPKLLNIKASTSGPDEFQILPTKPLEAPESFSELPTPTPGGANRTDPTPRADAIAALGGDAAKANALRAGEGALVTHATRFGVSQGIRDVLAAEDLEWRRDNNGRLLERLFNVNVYFRAYRVMELDQYRELERLRRTGAWTPAVPPDGAQTQ
ncbi:DUF3035 domain-containing protein [Aliiroseovarius subalbicans]|uniref:DUF3035 domain-containing protein n=1 Tax=Aliiroseovarius subalbicans TaxID=2925840 RepID=UPI001F5625C6|nr:DUF3035 domain-containing protein [Aliiroseovarius subalbicans]MCI2399839.1 DUF3035 domain-containing protein [Aliiroseovarius subalbicans]